MSFSCNSCISREVFFLSTNSLTLEAGEKRAQSHSRDSHNIMKRRSPVMKLSAKSSANYSCPATRNAPQSDNTKTDGDLVAVRQPMMTRRPYNVYNLFFILERARLIQACIEDVSSGTAAAIQQSSTSYHVAGYDHLCLPELPPRYHGLQLPSDWCVPGKNARRKHVATNGRE